SLALAALPGAHWSALTPAAPLRYWRLVEVGPGPSLTTSPLRIDEWALHRLAGVPYLDDRLAGLVEPVPGGPEPVTSHRALAERIGEVWGGHRGAELPAVQLVGDDPAGGRAVAAAACAALGLSLAAVPAPALPAAPAELDALARLCLREYALAGRAFLLE